MPRFVGVDAGGSTTVAALAHDDEIVRTYAGGGANARAIGVEAAADAIAAAVERVLGGERADAVAVGAAGAGGERVRAELHAALCARLGPAPIWVGDDAQLALRAAIPHGDGIVLIAGTGAIAYAEIGDERRRAGGYGHLVGDEGSGYAIGAAALRRLFHSFDAGTSGGAMLDAIALHVGATNLQDALATLYESASPVAAIAGCAPVVLEHAARGERAATAIVQQAARALFDLVAMLARPLSTRDVPIAFSGGLLRENNLLTYLLELRIANEFPYLHPVRPAAEPYAGALAQARRLLDRS